MYYHIILEVLIMLIISGFINFVRNIGTNTVRQSTTVHLQECSLAHERDVCPFLEFTRKQFSFSLKLVGG